jgi:copper ion binding protein
MTTTTTYTVTGMSCQHCVDAVTAEVGRLSGVEQVQVDLPSGAVSVTSTAPLDLDAVLDALDEAGYDLADEG